MVYQGRDIRVGLDQIVGKIHRMRRGEADALHSWYIGDVLDQLCQICLIAVDFAEIRIHILTQQMNLSNAA